MDRLQDAVIWATEAHAGQYRDGRYPIPYIAHPIEVMSLLRYVGGVEDEELLCAAVLHDTLEETSIGLVDVESRMGSRVARLVQALTRREPSEAERAGLTKDAIWSLRSNLLLEDIEMMDREAWPIKLADRLSNLREAFRTKSPKKLDRYRQQTTAILRIIPKQANPPLWSEICAINDPKPDA